MGHLTYLNAYYREHPDQARAPGRFHLAEWCRPCMYTLSLFNCKCTSLTRDLRLVIQSGLLAATSATLLTFFKDDSNFTHLKSATRDAILTLTYLSLIFSILATATSVALTVAHVSTRGNPSGFSFIAFQNCTTIQFEL